MDRERPNAQRWFSPQPEETLYLRRRTDTKPERQNVNAFGPILALGFLARQNPTFTKIVGPLKVYLTSPLKLVLVAVSL